MKLKKISIRSFRNIDEAVVFPESRFNIIVGKNAQGKTNILESIYLLGTMKSFRMHKNIDLIKFGSPYSLLKGWVEMNGIVKEISISVEPMSKKARVDNKSVSRPSDFFGCLNMVVFSPEDISMIRGLPESRRRYLDRAVFSGDVRYLSIHQEFYKILKNRNVLLRSGKTDGLDTWTERLAKSAARLLLKRISYIDEISELLAEFYATISGLQERACVRYRSSAIGTRFSFSSPEEVERRILEDLKNNSAEELRKGTTLVGPHRDDIDLCIDGRHLKIHGSQGEHRSFILALKMAEIEYIKKRYGSPPVLLLDDMTSELDGDRNHNFMEFLNSRDMQVFITTTSTDNLRFAQNANFTVFPIRGGRILK
jgi:DNA replication and repair protein RecF